jgi:hypothetical protein
MIDLYYNLLVLNRKMNKSPFILLHISTYTQLLGKQWLSGSELKTGFSRVAHFGGAHGSGLALNFC